MKLIREARETFQGDPDWKGQAVLEVRWENRGEPYREGCTFSMQDGSDHVSVMLLPSELQRMYRVLKKMLGPNADD
jgi:hypothetical protein